MYMPMNNTCMDIAMSVEKAGPPDGYGLSTKVRHVPGVDAATAPVGPTPGRVRIDREDAVDLSAARADFTGPFSRRVATWSFPAIVVRRFRAFDATSGAVVWETILNAAVSARPMTYSVGGRQYLAVGSGGVTQGSRILEGLTPELNTTSTGNTLFVFALPEP